MKNLNGLAKKISEVTCKVLDFGIVWRTDGILHREDGPAIEYSNGTVYWYLDGLRHRADGPAIIYNNGDKFWYRHGQLHREDGAAVEYWDGGKEWHLNGQTVSYLSGQPCNTQEQFETLMKARAFW